MKIERDQTIFVGESTQSKRSQQPEEKQAQKAGQKSIFAGDLSGVTDPILQKKQEAQQKALKVVSDAWDGDKKIDEDIVARQENIKSLQSEMGEARKELSALEQEKERLRGQYEDEKNPEYQSRVEELNKHIEYYRVEVDSKQKNIQAENAVIKGIKQERLKSAPMAKAQKQAEAIESAASEEIMGMLMEESKEHIDGEMAKQEEKAEAVEEKKEAEEELLEKRKTEREEAEERAEEIAESVPVQEMLILDRKQYDIQKEVQDIMDKMKLVAEDIKGAMVDENI